MSAVIPFPRKPADDDGDGFRPSRAREVVAGITSRPLPSAARVRATARWWARQTMLLLPWLPVLVLRELRPILRGAGRVAVRWSAWVHCAALAEAVTAAEGNERSKAQERLVKRRTARAWLTVAALVVLAAASVWAQLTYGWGPIVLAALVLVCVFDAVGRAGREQPDNPLPVATTPPWNDPAVSLQQLTRTVVEALEREGFEPGTVQVARPMWVDDRRMERRVRIKTADKIRPEHIEAIEIALGAPNGSIRNLGTESAAVRELAMRFGDPLATVPPPEDLPTGSLSIARPLEIGVSANDVPFAICFAGTHVAVVGMTGSGKSKSVLWSMIDRISVCRDAVIWGIDLAQGPALPMWRGVIQRRAFTPADADELLDAAIAEIERRMRVLTAIAEDDDPDNDTDEWHSGLGPALVVVADEFALIAEHDGTRGRADLLGKFEQIVRTGRKVWVSVVLGTQKTGNSDFGSRVMSTQLGVKILLACAESDVVTLLSTTHRDAGWRPDLLEPSVEGDVRDAGKCYVSSPAHRTPDIYRAFAPLSTGEVKRRARQRVEDGLPTLDGRPAGHVDAVDAVEVPGLLAAVERVFVEAGRPEWLPTVDIMAALRERGVAASAVQIGEALRIDPNRKPGTKRRVEGGAQQWGYEWAAVEAKIRSLG